MKRWTSPVREECSAECLSGAHCLACRTSRPFRESIVKAGMMDDPEFPCPFGVTPENAFPESRYDQSEWPMWAKALAMFKHQGEKGVGDTAQAYIGEANSDRFKKWYALEFGRGCACDFRHTQWNILYPYQLSQK